MAQIAEPYIPLRAIRHLEKGRVVIFAAGMGAPYFSTDTTAAQRALEIKAEAILKGTRSTASTTPTRRRTRTRSGSTDLEYMEVLARGLAVMDATAISLCMENRLPILVFDLCTQGNIKRALLGRADRHARPRPAVSAHAAGRGAAGPGALAPERVEWVGFRVGGPLPPEGMPRGRGTPARRLPG